MGLFDLFIKRNKENNTIKNELKYADSSTISPDEIAYYKPDEYYVFEWHTESPLGIKVITFEERKKISYPSRNGLYVAEILLLDYCNRGDYPKPKNGYPGFWWFKYGIRDIGNALKSLEQRGFIEFTSKMESLKSLRTTELKEIACINNIKTNQNKEELINEIKNIVSETDIPEKYISSKYKLTELGKQELQENEYVPYMHKHKFKTNESAPVGLSFTIWDINKLLANKDKTKWREIVGKIEKEKYGVDLVNKINTIDEAEFKVANDYDIKGYKTAGIEKYQILTAIDDRTCEECKKLDGKIFKVSEAKSGINVPPFHPGCRCTTIAYFEDDEI